MMHFVVAAKPVQNSDDRPFHFNLSILKGEIIANF